MPSPNPASTNHPMTLLRTESFVPLTTRPASSEPREFHVTVAPQTANLRPLPSANGGLNGGANGGSNGGGHSQQKTCEPRVSLQCDGDRITGIRVQCGCGQVMDLACVYDAAPRA